MVAAFKNTIVDCVIVTIQEKLFIDKNNCNQPTILVGLNK
jgi:hypothetical protein